MPTSQLKYTNLQQHLYYIHTRLNSTNARRTRVLGLLISLSRSPIRRISGVATQQPTHIACFRSLNNLHRNRPYYTNPISRLRPLRHLITMITMPNQNALQELRRPTLLMVPRHKHPHLHLPHRFSSPRHRLHRQLSLRTCFGIRSFEDNHVDSQFRLRRTS